MTYRVPCCCVAGSPPLTQEVQPICGRPGIGFFQTGWERASWHTGTDLCFGFELAGDEVRELQAVFFVRLKACSLPWLVAGAHAREFLAGRRCIVIRRLSCKLKNLDVFCFIFCDMPGRGNVWLELSRYFCIPCTRTLVQQL